MRGAWRVPKGIQFSFTHQIFLRYMRQIDIKWNIKPNIKHINRRKKEETLTHLTKFSEGLWCREVVTQLSFGRGLRCLKLNKQVIERKVSLQLQSLLESWHKKMPSRKTCQFCPASKIAGILRFEVEVEGREVPALASTLHMVPVPM